jgi:hypothetical protein
MPEYFKENPAYHFTPLSGYTVNKEYSKIAAIQILHPIIISILQ